MDGRIRIAIGNLGGLLLTLAGVRIGIWLHSKWTV
jgi:hypothetical protein